MPLEASKAVLGAVSIAVELPDPTPASLRALAEPLRAVAVELGDCPTGAAQLLQVCGEGRHSIFNVLLLCGLKKLRAQADEKFRACCGEALFQEKLLSALATTNSGLPAQPALVEGVSVVPDLISGTRSQGAR